MKTVDDEHALLRGRTQAVGGRERRLERPAHDQLDQLGLGRVGVERALVLAVAEHGDPIGDLEDLGKPVADVHDADATLPAGGDRAVERFDLVRAERGGRLVEEQTFGSVTRALATSKSWRSASVRIPPGIREQLQVEVELAEQLVAPTSCAASTAAALGGAARYRLFLTGRAWIDDVS